MTKSNVNGTDQPNVEPCEVDPCMGDSSTKDPNFFVRLRSDVCKRWGLSHKVFYTGAALLGLLLVLLIVVIALGATWPHVPHSQRFPVCKEAECLRGASQIREAMNSSASPCTDLWTWACGGWLSRHPLPKDKSVWNQKQQLVTQEATRVRDLITTLNSPLHSVSVEWKLKHLYEACLDVDNVNSDEARPLTNIISELGGWYILRNWDTADFDAKQVLKQLQVKHGVSPFFRITVEDDPYTPGLSSIRISPSGLGLPDQEYYRRDDRIQDAYKELIREVVRYLGATRKEAEKFGNHMFFYEQRIAEVTPSSQKLQNPVLTCNHIKVSELKDTILNVPLYDILTAMYPGANIHETTEVLVSSLEYLTEISQIIATTDRQTMNGYLIWTLVRQYLPYLSEKFTSAVDNFKAELFGIRVPPKRWEVCSNLVQEFMGLAINAMEARTSPISNETNTIVRETYRNVKKVVEARIEKFRAMPLMHKQFKQKLENMQLQVGLPPRVTEPSYVKDYYTKLTVIKSNFFESVHYAMEFRKKLEETLLIKNSREHTIISQTNKMVPEVAYLPSENLVLIPQNLLDPPFFENKYPRALIYGRLGSAIAGAIVSSVLPYDSFWTGDKKLLTAYHVAVNESLKSVSGPQDCLFKAILNSNLDVPYDIANATALLTLKHISAISVGNEALKSSSTEHIHQPALEEYEDSALYFLSYAQTQCSESTNQFQVFENFAHFRLPQRSLLHVVWAQLPEFSDSFECSADKKTQCLGVF